MSLIRETLKKSRAMRAIVDRARRVVWSRDKLLSIRYVPKEAFSTKLRHDLLEIIEERGASSIGDYLEFGVFNGGSLASAYAVFQELGLHRSRFFGFDSFEGLPPHEANVDDLRVWLPHEFSCPIDVTRQLLSDHGVDWDRVFLIKGWFSEVLTQNLLQQHALTKATVIMIDCDLYSSTVTSLDFVEPLIEDVAIMVFDDWFARGLAERRLGERLAFEEWLAKHPTILARPCGRYHQQSLTFRLARTDASNGPREGRVATAPRELGATFGYTEAVQPTSRNRASS